MKLPANGSLQLEKKACSGMELVPAGAREVLEEIMLGQAGDWSGSIGQNCLCSDYLTE